MDIKTFKNITSSLPPDISVLLRGPTGIGKSQLFHQIAGEIEVDGRKGLPVIDRRLSQMTEGDIIGLPELVDGVTRFCPVDWVVKACHEPVVLFLDEINRATPEVMQCAFQLVLDRELNGNRLHPETRIYCAINASSDYQVNEIDPALLRRFWTVDLEPTKADWVKWANENGIDPIVVDFINNNEAHLRHIGAMEPGKVYPNPASQILYIDLADNAGEIEDLYFVDFAGKVIDNVRFKQTGDKAAVNTEYLQTGIYLLDVTTKLGHSRVKVIIQK